MFLGCFSSFFANLVGPLSYREATVWSEKPLLSPKNLAYDHLMEIEWLITGATAKICDQSRKWRFYDNFWFSGQIGLFFLCPEAILWYGNLILSPKNLNYDHLMKIVHMVDGCADAVGTPDISSRKSSFLGYFDVLGQFKPVLWFRKCKMDFRITLKKSQKEKN